MKFRIAILTSGGDAPGMNAVIHRACQQIDRTGGLALGVRDGFAGLAAGKIEPIRADQVAAESSKPGTWLGSSRWAPMQTSDGVAACVSQLAKAKVRGLVVLGGDGSLQAAACLAARGIHTALVPCTIDNDVRGTSTTIGFDSAVRYATDVIVRIRFTSRALPGRAFVVETLGGPKGHLAEAVAHAAGIEVVLVPERPVDLSLTARRLQALAPSGDAIAVMSEGFGDAVRISESIAQLSGLRVHPTILGHAQRAADVSRRDRYLAIKAGGKAVDELATGKASALVALGPAPGQPGPVRLSVTELTSIAKSTSRVQRDSA